MPVHPKLRAVFDAFDRDGIAWCVLRGEDELERPPADVDILVARDDYDRARAVLAPLAFARVPAYGRGSHSFFRAYDRDSDQWLMLDVVTELAYGPWFSLATHAEGGCLERRRRRAGVNVLARADAFWTLLLHCLLDKGCIEPRYADRLGELAAAASPADPLGEIVTGAAPRDWPAARFIQAAGHGDWAALEAVAPRLGRRWRRRAAFPVAWRVAAGSFARLAEKPAVWRYRRGISAALLGPDGTGKSTIARAAGERFCFPAATVYMGLWAGDGREHRGAASLVVRALARPARVWLRYLRARAHQLAGRAVIFDRYTYDAWLPPRPPYARAKRLYFSLLARLCPAPDLVLLLDAPPGTILARKDEETPAEIAWQRDEFLKLGRRLPGLQVVDAARPRHEVTAEVVDRIWRQHVARRAA